MWTSRAPADAAAVATLRAPSTLVSQEPAPSRAYAVWMTHSGGAGAMSLATATASRTSSRRSPSARWTVPTSPAADEDLAAEIPRAARHEQAHRWPNAGRRSEARAGGPPSRARRRRRRRPCCRPRRPQRSSACSSVSHVRSPKLTGTPVSSAAWITPRDGLAADVVEVRRAAADHAAERDHGLVAAGLGQPPARERQLPRPGHQHDRDAAGADAALLEARDSAVEEPLDDIGVVPDATTATSCVRGAALDLMAAFGHA